MMRRSKLFQPAQRDPVMLKGGEGEGAEYSAERRTESF